MIIESKEVSENSRRSLTKALRGLLAHFDERFEDLAERIAITLAGTEAEEQNKRLRTEALLLIEKDRESVSDVIFSSSCLIAQAIEGKGLGSKGGGSRRRILAAL